MCLCLEGIIVCILVFNTAQSKTSPPARVSTGLPSVEQQVMIDDVIASGPEPKGGWAGSEEGDVLVCLSLLYNTLRSFLRRCTWIAKVSAQTIDLKTF